MCSFTARVVHAGDDGIFRVFVTVGVHEPSDPARWPARTNRLRFIFATSASAARTVLPVTYNEVLMQVRVHPLLFHPS